MFGLCIRARRRVLTREISTGQVEVTDRKDNPNGPRCHGVDLKPRSNVVVVPVDFVLGKWSICSRRHSQPLVDKIKKIAAVRPPPPHRRRTGGSGCPAACAPSEDDAIRGDAFSHPPYRVTLQCYGCKIKGSAGDRWGPGTSPAHENQR